MDGSPLFILVELLQMLEQLSKSSTLMLSERASSHLVRPGKVGARRPGIRSMPPALVTPWGTASPVSENPLLLHTAGRAGGHVWASVLFAVLPKAWVRTQKANLFDL